MKNKKGNLHIVVLVFLVLSLLLTSIFTGRFLQDRVDNKYELKNIQEINSNKILLEQNLYVVSKTAFVKTFREFSLGGEEYDYVQSRKNTGEFYELHEKLEENFKKRFKENFLEILGHADTPEEKLRPQYTSLKLGHFDLNYSSEKLKLNFTYNSANEQENNLDDSLIINLKYQTPIEIFVDFEKVSLEGFSEIYLAKENCKYILDGEEMKKCFEKHLPNFIVDIENVSEYRDNTEKIFPFEMLPSSEEDLKLVKLKTKEYFVFENELEQINVTFVPR